MGTRQLINIHKYKNIKKKKPDTRNQDNLLRKYFNKIHIYAK